MFAFFLFSPLILSKSRFGAPGTDEIILDLTDGFEVLERGLRKPTGIKDISEAHYSEYIEPSTYPWPGHKLTCDWQQLRYEGYYIRTNFRRSNVTESECYKHPAGALQFETTQEEVDRADRVKVRVIMTPRYIRHYPPVFFPPGELIQIDVLPAVANRIQIRMNKFQSSIWDVSGTPKYAYRIDQMRLEAFYLASTHNTVCHPYGGVPDFDTMSNPEPIEVNITGVILCPFFRYGLHSDEEWENELSRLPGPVATIETGNMVISVPAKYVRSATRLNDACKWWRSAYQISQTTARDGYNTYDDRPLNILELNFECFVPAGAAVAFVGANYCHFPQSWVDSQVNVNSYMSNPWGNVHEMNHHHQSNWGPNGGVDEISNNIINLIIYAQSNECSKSRPTSGWGRYSHADHPLGATARDFYEEYSILIHQFGWELTRKFIRADQSDDPLGENITRNYFGSRRNAELCRMAVIFRADFQYFVQEYFPTVTLINDNVNASIFYNESYGFIQREGIKPFHPVANKYMVGRVLPSAFNENGKPKEYYSARPYYVTCQGDSPTEIFDFNPTFRPSLATFEFKSIEFCADTEQKRWEEVPSDGNSATNTHLYKIKALPKGFDDDPLFVEEIRVTYEDKSSASNDVDYVTVICQLQYGVNGAYCWEWGGSQNGGYNLYENDVFWAAEHFNEGTLIRNASVVSGLTMTQEAWMHGYFGYTKGYLSVPETGDYVFALAVEDEGAFYISEDEISLDPNESAPYLINYQPTPCYNFLETNHSEPIYLNASKSYHFLLYGLKKGTGKGGNKIQISIGYQTSATSFQTVPNEWVSFVPSSAKQLWDNQYEPIYQRILYMDPWDGQTFKPYDQSKFIAFNYPGKGTKGFDCVINSKSGEGAYTNVWTDDEVTRVLFDNDGTTEFRSRWWSGRGPVQQFPMFFEIDMVDNQTFKEMNIMPPGNQGYFPMNSSIQIAVSYNETFPDEDLQIWEGVYDSKGNTIIQFEEEFHGRYLRITFYNNTYRWKDGHPPKVCFSGIQLGESVEGKKVIPMTHYKMIRFNSSQWEEVRNGWYYNGKAFTGQKGAYLEIGIEPNITKFGLIGDGFPGMGTAEIKFDNGTELPGIDGPYDILEQNRRLQYATKAHRILLMYKDIGKSEEPRVVRLRVTSGSITLTGVLTDLDIITNVLEKDDPEPYDYTNKDMEGHFTLISANLDGNGFYTDTVDKQINNVKRKNSTPIILGVLIPVAIIGIGIVCVAFYLYYHPEIVFSIKSKKNMKKESLVNNSFVI